GEVACGAEPALVKRRLVEREQAVRQVRVVLEHALPARSAVLPRPAQPAVRPAESGEQLVGRYDGGIEVVRLRARTPAVGERADREAVPRRERLVVPRRLRPGAAALEEPSPGSRETLLALR